MRRINELIAEHCPGGVENVSLGELVVIKNGRDYKHLGDGDVPVYGSGGVMTHVDTAAHPGPSVLIPRKGSLDNVFYVDEPFWTVDTIFYTEIGERVDGKYLYYFLLNSRLGDMNQAGGVPSQTQTALKKIRVPLPPLVLQREIAGILDLFTGLEAALETELEARRRQYEHYRNRLLEFDGEVEWTPLGDIATIGTGSHDTKDAVPNGRYVFYARGRDPLRLDSYDFDESAIITAGDGVGVGKVFHFVTGQYALHQRAYRIVPKAGVDARYLYHYLVADFARYLERTSVHASVTSLRRPMFLKYQVALPPLEEQRRISGILDEFDALVSNSSEGIPAELRARQKQYEYYREKLLSFEELPG